MANEPSADYLPGFSISEFEKFFTQTFPDMAPALWLNRPDEAAFLGAMYSQVNEFESDEAGRGDSFRQAHERSSVKATGMSRLLEMATNTVDVSQLPTDFRLLDVLGGDGTLVRVTGELAQWKTSKNWILTGDVTPGMVRRALDHGQPAIRQPAQFLLCRDNTFDAVLVAYGAHHIPVAERQQCYREALRVLRSGGRLVVHDFQAGSPMARWFSEVVDSYSPTGHKYTHFTPEGLTEDLKEAGFDSVQVGVIYDPITVKSGDAVQAKSMLMQYVINAYGLTPHEHRNFTTDELHQWVQGLVTSYLHYTEPELISIGTVPPAVVSEGTFAIYETPDGWRGELPRLALVAVAVKA
jgi:ubiquinone/menaquinone biosynthesis C-methylase UbiE